MAQTKMHKDMEKNMKNIFHMAQFNKTDHVQCIKKLTKLYEKTAFNKFWECFLSCLKVPLTKIQQHQHIINTLEFCAKFSLSSYSASESENTAPMSPFLNKLFNFLLSSHKAKDKVVRFRICYFLNVLLNSMGECAFVDDELCDKIITSMMDRLLDKSPKVRAQAIFALRRLQDPSDEKCSVIEMYLFHLLKDPNAEVRRAVLTCIGKNQKSLQAALNRIHDIDQSVRKLAYEFISKITVRSLTIEQRETLLKSGLKDRSEIVRTYVSNFLLPTWLQYYNGEYINFIHALDVGIGTETATLALEILFKKADLNNLLGQIPIDKDTRMIPLQNISSDNVLYWKCIIKYLYQLSYTEKIELVIPELSKFCIYIRDFIAFISSKQHEEWEQQCHIFILLQLFQISETYDLSDEVGRIKLKELIIDTLISDCCSNKIIECVVSHLAKVIPDINNMIDVIIDVISEVRVSSKENVIVPQITAKEQHENDLQKARLKVELVELGEEQYQAIKKEDFLLADNLKEKIKSLKEKINQMCKVTEMAVIPDDICEEKNDPTTMMKCLSILCAAIESQSILAITPILQSQLSIVLSSLDHPDDGVHVLALKALALYCILDKELAKKHLTIFFLQFCLEQENHEIWIIALKGIFDILLMHGLDYFDILQSAENSAQIKSEKSRSLYTQNDSIVSIDKQRETEENNCNFVKILMGLLDNTNQDIRTTAAEGFCKLLLNQRINSSSLVSRLIILFYNPMNADDNYLLQCLSCFFDNFVLWVPNAKEMLENAYFATLKILCNAPDISPLQQIDTYKVSRFILSLTREKYQKPGGQMFYTHNSLAFAILAEILNPDTKIELETLIKSLTYLHIQIEDGPSKENLQGAIENVTKMVMESDKRLLKYIQQFKKKLEGASEAMETDIEKDKSEDED